MVVDQWITDLFTSTYLKKLFDMHFDRKSKVHPYDQLSRLLIFNKAEEAFLKNVFKSCVPTLFNKVFNFTNNNYQESYRCRKWSTKAVSNMMIYVKANPTPRIYIQVDKVCNSDIVFTYLREVVNANFQIDAPCIYSEFVRCMDLFVPACRDDRMVNDFINTYQKNDFEKEFNRNATNMFDENARVLKVLLDEKKKLRQCIWNNTNMVKFMFYKSEADKAKEAAEEAAAAEAIAQKFINEKKAIAAAEKADAEEAAKEEAAAEKASNSKKEQEEEEEEEEEPRTPIQTRKRRRVPDAPARGRRLRSSRRRRTIPDSDTDSDTEDDDIKLVVNA